MNPRKSVFFAWWLFAKCVHFECKLWWSQLRKTNSGWCLVWWNLLPCLWMWRWRRVVRFRPLALEISESSARASHEQLGAGMCWGTSQLYPVVRFINIELKIIEGHSWHGKDDACRCRRCRRWAFLCLKSSNRMDQTTLGYLHQLKVPQQSFNPLDILLFLLPLDAFQSLKTWKGPHWTKTEFQIHEFLWMFNRITTYHPIDA